MARKKQARQQARQQARRQARRRRARAQGTLQTTLLNGLHQVWLAGLGAAVRAQRGAPKLLDELIAEGAAFQEGKQELAEDTFRRIAGDARARLKEGLGQMRGQAGEALENLEKIFQSRVQRALAQLGVPSADELAALSRRVDALNSHIGKLAKRRAPVPRTRVESKSAVAAVP
jgi:poly(hydroxyalkanoate) granule-associated protein